MFWRTIWAGRYSGTWYMSILRLQKRPVVDRIRRWYNPYVGHVTLVSWRSCWQSRGCSARRGATIRSTRLGHSHCLQKVHIPNFVAGFKNSSTILFADQYVLFQCSDPAVDVIINQIFPCRPKLHTRTNLRVLNQTTSKHRFQF